MATAAPILNIQSPDNELAKQTVFIKLHLGLLGNSRKVSSSRVEVDADKALIRVSKTLLDSPELQAIRTLDGDIRHFLYDMCLPFEVGIHLLPLCLMETVDERLHEFKDRRGELVESFQIVCFGRLAEVCGQYFDKGRHVYIEGRLQTRKWEDRGGEKRTTIEVVVNQMQILDRAPKNGSSAKVAESAKPADPVDEGDNPFNEPASVTADQEIPC